MTAFLLALVALLAAATAALRHRRSAHRRRPAHARIVDPRDGTSIGVEGAMRSVQAADLTLPASALDALWSPMQLERLARTYWRYLTHVTLGLIRVDYSERERTIVLLRQPLRLLRFKAPEFAMDAEQGVVRWRIEDGLLVERRGHGADGYLQIDVRRRPPDPTHAPGMAMLRVEVEVANFYPSIAHRLSRHVYRATQSRIHVLVTHGFLRSLERLDLAESRVGRYASIDAPPSPDDVPAPPLPDLTSAVSDAVAYP